MPSKHIVKHYIENGYYHVYNRGVNKMNIFKEEQDYAVFLSYIKSYLLPKDINDLFIKINTANLVQRDKQKIVILMRIENYYNKITLLAYCLMPNHFHLLLQQQDKADLQHFMRSLMTRYTQYFNRKYKRRGPLCEGNYKGILVQSDQQLWHLSRYIHRNPLGFYKKGQVKNDMQNIMLSQPSSYLVYLNRIKQEWVKPQFILQNFAQKGINCYQSFVENSDYNVEEKSIRTIYSVALDYDE